MHPELGGDIGGVIGGAVRHYVDAGEWHQRRRGPQRLFEHRRLVVSGDEDRDIRAAEPVPGADECRLLPVSEHQQPQPFNRQATKSDNGPEQCVCAQYEHRDEDDGQRSHER
jgi:hypothetical protein